MKTKVANLKTDLMRGLDHIGVSAAAVIYDDEGRILLMQRGPKARDEQGCWDICGGAIEFGESIDEAIRREVKEELCAEPTDIQFLTIYDAHRTHTDGRPTHWIALAHAVKVDPSKVRVGEPHKISQIGWFFSHELPSPLHSQFQKNYQPALERGIVK
jgi:8-oxo-dGTP diphosphatase